MYKTLFVGLLLVAGVMFLIYAGPVQAAEKEGEALLSVLDLKATGDLDEMKKRGFIRVLVGYSRTNFFIVGGEPRGFEYELLQQYKKFLNKGVSKRKKGTGINYIPVPFNRLIPALIEGKGDIAAAGLTITSERLQSASFTTPYIPNVNEIVVTSKKVNGLKTLDDLSGRTVYVLRGSSYFQHLKELNHRLQKQKLAPVKIIEAHENLMTEDILELVNAGVIDITVADDHLAQIWSNVLGGLVLRHNLRISKGGKIGWAVRKNNPKLLKSLNTFIKKNRKGTLMGNILFKRYYRNARWIKNPLDKNERAKLDKFILLFKRYGDKYGFDWLSIGAQAYQESGLDHSKKSAAGAIGVMQMLKSTASGHIVGIPDIEVLEKNIHASVKYMSYLRKRYFSDPEIDPSDRVFFSYAAYNAGPGRVIQLRRETKNMGLDSNKWFNNVELAALKVVGMEPVRYVSNIFKYYIAYKLIVNELETKANKLKAIEMSKDK